MPSPPPSAHLVALAAVAAATVAACSAPVVDDVADASGSTTQAIVLVDRVAADGATQTNVSAKFMRLSGAADPEAAERIVGSRLDLPPTGDCVVLTDEDADGSAIASLGSIELLDVGDVTLRAGGSPLALAPRAFPDVGALVSGVVYTSRDAQTELPAPATYVLETTGSQALDAFALEAEAPSAPEDVRIAGEELDPAHPAVILEGNGVSVRWRAAPTSHDELIYVDVASPTNGAAVRCAFNDTGEAVIPASLLRTDTFGRLPATASVGVHRVRLGSFGLSTAAGAPAAIDLGEVRFDLGVVGRISIEPAARE